MEYEQEKRVAGIILAAGMSTRMGATKQLLMFHGKPLLENVVANARAAGFLSPLIIVLGHHASEIRQKIAFEDVRVVIAKEYHTGQSASLKAGLSAIPESCDGVLFLLGDQPFITAGIIGKIVAAFNRSAADIIIPTYGGKRGNPVLIARSLFPQLFSISGDVGARCLFNSNPDRVMEIKMEDEKACLDIDTWETYQYSLSWSKTH